jgi:hypothetical protein
VVIRLNRACRPTLGWLARPAALAAIKGELKTIWELTLSRGFAWNKYSCVLEQVFKAYMVE